MSSSRTTRQHEHTINVVMAGALDKLGFSWTVEPEPLGVFSGEGRADLLIHSERVSPVVIEAEVNEGSQAAAKAEKEAIGRLGLQLSGRYGNWDVDTVIALLYPQLPNIRGVGELDSALQESRFEYALYALDSNESVVRFPASGWIKGGISDLACFIHMSRSPAWRIEEMADSMRESIVAAAVRSRQIGPSDTAGEGLAQVMRQEDDDGDQTRRMAMAVLLNAMLFHDALERSKFKLKKEGRRLKPIDFFSSNRGFNGYLLRMEWQYILEENYWPIFSIAQEILGCLSNRPRALALQALWYAGSYLSAQGVMKSHDLIGTVFQRLVSDRQFWAAYYTRPEAAWLLAGLALTGRFSAQLKRNGVGKMRIGDFACGTGTLLTTAYQRYLLLYESQGGDPATIHAEMMENGLVGLDVLPIAVHLTATMLASLFPHIMFEGECILKMPYGFYRKTPLVGSLELLSESDMDYRAMFGEHAEVVGGQREERSFDFNQRIGNDFDLVIMNPPFTRSGDDIKGAISPVAAMDFTKSEQVKLNDRIKKLTKGGMGQGSAGLASHFTDIGHRRLRPGGMLALVLPMTALTGKSWNGIRKLWRGWYSDIVVATIAGAKGLDCSFSSDTGMSECLFVGAKRDEFSGSKRRGKFVTMDALPTETVAGAMLADAIHEAIEEKNVPALEAGPFGGRRIQIGDAVYGSVMDCPLPEDDSAWAVAGIRDLSLAQCAYQLERGILWLPGMSEGFALPVARMGKVVQFGRYHLAIAGKTISKESGLPQGPFEVQDGCSKADEYPSLWKHDASKERTLIVEPYQHLRVQKVPGKSERELAPLIEHVLERNSRVHYNFDFQFNSQSTIVVKTERPTIGGSAWPNILLEDEGSECLFSLWCNSTLGLLSHWWMASKTQGGRGRVSHGTAGAIPTLDLTKSTKNQRLAAKKIFGQKSDIRFLPFNQMHEDQARKELDRTLLEEVLGLPATLCENGGPMQTLREKLASEPQIHGGKKTRLVLAANGENVEKLSAEARKRLGY